MIEIDYGYSELLEEYRYCDSLMNKWYARKKKLDVISDWLLLLFLVPVVVLFLTKSLGMLDRILMLVLSIVWVVLTYISIIMVLSVVLSETLSKSGLKRLNTYLRLLPCRFETFKQGFNIEGEYIVEDGKLKVNDVEYKIIGNVSDEKQPRLFKEYWFNGYTGLVVREYVKWVS